MRHGYRRLKSGQIDLYYPRVLGVFIRLKYFRLALKSILYILHGLFVDREYAVFAAGFYRHIGDGEAVVHRKLGYALSCELERLIQSTVDSDLTYKMEDHVFARYIRLKLTAELYLYGVWYSEPVEAGCHSGSHVCRADSC